MNKYQEILSDELWYDKLKIMQMLVNEGATLTEILNKRSRSRYHATKRALFELEQEGVIKCLHDTYWAA